MSFKDLLSYKDFSRIILVFEGIFNVPDSIRRIAPRFHGMLKSVVIKINLLL